MQNKNFFIVRLYYLQQEKLVGIYQKIILYCIANIQNKWRISKVKDGDKEDCSRMVFRNQTLYLWSFIEENMKGDTAY